MGGNLMFKKFQYPEDPRRRNEFGQIGEDDVDEKIEDTGVKQISDSKSTSIDNMDESELISRKIHNNDKEEVKSKLIENVEESKKSK
jgi:hypothetical protein